MCSGLTVHVVVVVPCLCAEFNGGAHPPLQAVHRGLPGSSWCHLHCDRGTQGRTQGKEDRL